LQVDNENVPTMNIYHRLLWGLILTLTLNLTLSAQEARQQALVVKKTATWCSNCGSWGWTWFKDIIADTQEENVISIALHSTASALKPPLGLDDDWLASFSTVGAFPTFYVNGGHHANYGSLLSTALARAAELPLVGITLETGHEQDQAYARARVTWQEAAAGMYALGLYIVEDSLVQSQAAQGANAIHRNVLRLGMGGLSFGELRNLDMQVGQLETWESQHTYPLASTDRHHILAVLWKKEQDKYVYINSALAPLEEGLLSGVETPSLEKPALAVFPNPMHRGGTLTLRAPESVGDRHTISIWGTDGRLLFQRDLGGGPEYQLTLPGHLHTGTYILELKSDAIPPIRQNLQILD
jgi:hypothetical protein